MYTFVSYYILKLTKECHHQPYQLYIALSIISTLVLLLLMIDTSKVTATKWCYNRDSRSLQRAMRRNIQKNAIQLC